jgi:hypothetical protein
VSGYNTPHHIQKKSIGFLSMGPLQFEAFRQSSLNHCLYRGNHLFQSVVTLKNEDKAAENFGQQQFF